MTKCYPSQLNNIDNVTLKAIIMETDIPLQCQNRKGNQFTKK